MLKTLCHAFEILQSFTIVLQSLQVLITTSGVANAQGATVNSLMFLGINVCIFETNHVRRD